MNKAQIRIITTMVLLLPIILSCCTSVQVIRHPDFIYPPNPRPNTITIYPQDLYPNKPYIIIGKIGIDATWTTNEREATRKVQLKVAEIGGDGVMIMNTQIDYIAFNQSVTTGSAEFQGNRINYYAVNRNTSTYFPTKRLYGYVIKWYNREAPYQK